jgi:hypothetical protein
MDHVEKVVAAEEVEALTVERATKLLHDVDDRIVALQRKKLSLQNFLTLPAKQEEDRIRRAKHLAEVQAQRALGESPHEPGPAA